MKVIVLGGGLVGGPMAMDLAEDPSLEVSVADISEEVLGKFKDHTSVEVVKWDLSESDDLPLLIDKYDMVVNAVPGFMGFETIKKIIETGKDVVDIAFYPEDPLTLDKLAKKHNVTAVVDCGVAPGMSNMLTGYVHSILDKTEYARIYVGGLPEVRRLPYEYRAVFSPVDVIEEYLRPAYYVEDGKSVTRPALSEPELLDFQELGTLEAFNTDGLRSLIKTLDIPDMREKTLRYPGHIEKINLLKESGFFRTDEIEVGGVRVKPIDVTTKLLFPLWKLQKGEVDITVMKIIVSGDKDGKKVRYTYDLMDKYNTETGVHSMARTTGYTATVVLRMLKDGLFKEKGIIPPEVIGQKKECVSYVLDGLKRRGIEYRETIEDI